MTEPSVAQLRKQVETNFNEARKDGTVKKLMNLVLAEGQPVSDDSPVLALKKGETDLTLDPRVNRLTVTIKRGEETVLSTADSTPKFIKRGPWLDRLIPKDAQAEPVAPAETEADKAEREALLSMLPPDQATGTATVTVKPEGGSK